MKETNISGADVANATTVNPITIRGILNILAIEVAPSTKKSDQTFLLMAQPL